MWRFDMGIIRVALVAGALALAVGAQSQTPASDSPKLTARELFYAAPEPAKRPVSGSKPQTSNKKTSPASQTTETTQSSVAEVRPKSSASSASAPIISVSDSGPLGLRYTILQRSGGQNVEV